MSGRIKVAVVDFPVLLAEAGGVHCASQSSFPVRKWCGKPGQHQNRNGKPFADEIANGTDEA